MTSANEKSRIILGRIRKRVNGKKKMPFTNCVYSLNVRNIFWRYGHKAVGKRWYDVNMTVNRLFSGIYIYTIKVWFVKHLQNHLNKNQRASNCFFFCLFVFFNSLNEMLTFWRQVFTCLCYNVQQCTQFTLRVYVSCNSAFYNYSSNYRLNFIIDSSFTIISDKKQLIITMKKLECHFCLKNVWIWKRNLFLWVRSP